MDVSLDRLLEDIEERDRRDSARSASPMRPADDALVIDTTRMGIVTVVDTILQAWRARSP